MPPRESLLQEAPDGYTVCEVLDYQDTQPTEANAQLIASSPRLAQALTDLIQYLGQDWDGDSMVEECKEVLAEAGCPFEYDEEESDD